MSRSYRRFPVMKDPASKCAKRWAAVAVRRYKGEIASGGWYKRLFNSWTISDYAVYAPRHRSPEMTDWQWHKSYRRK